jgi:short-subunit dehydrogenase
MRAWIEGIDRARPLDLVIANAGISTGRGREEDGETMRQVFAVNVDGVLNTVLPAIPLLRARRRGQIALMGSLAGFRGLPSATAYSASKAAVKSLGESWRLLLERDGIGVSVICPGFVTTRMTARNKVRMPFLMPAERAASIIATGLARNRPRIAFPFPTAAVSWLMEALPAGWSDALARRAGV